MPYWLKKFGLGVIFAAVVVALVILGMEAIKAARTRRAIDTVRQLGGAAYRSDVCFDNGFPHGVLMPMNPPGWPTRCAQALGVDWFFDVVHVAFRGDYTGNPVADADLAVLGELPDLLNLDLCHTGIGDEGLTHIAKLKKLRHLDLRRTRVTDAGLARLAELKSLEFVDLDNTRVTRRGIEGLKQAIPGLKTSPIVGGDMADWDKLRDELDKFMRERHPTDATRAPLKAGTSPSSVGH
jgi:hypothetical protein